MAQSRGVFSVLMYCLKSSDCNAKFIRNTHFMIYFGKVYTVCVKKNMTKSKYAVGDSVKQEER